MSARVSTWVNLSLSTYEDQLLSQFSVNPYLVGCSTKLLTNCNGSMLSIFILFRVQDSFVLYNLKSMMHVLELGGFQ